jgi:hypothetical protein
MMTPLPPTDSFIGKFSIIFIGGLLGFSSLGGVLCCIIIYKIDQCKNTNRSGVVLPATPVTQPRRVVVADHQPVAEQLPPRSTIVTFKL